MSGSTRSAEFDVKECPDCRELKPFSEFGRNKRMADGLARYCKVCFCVRSKVSYRKRMAEKGRTVREWLEVPEGFKFCPRCGAVKPHVEFGSNRAEKSGLTAYCKPCHNQAMVENKARNHGSVRNYLLKLRYGVTAAEIDERRLQQGGICVICLRGSPDHVDHNHETGLFRGLLCFSCNGGLGQFEDDTYRLRQAAGYLDGEISHARVMELEFGAPTLDGFARRHASRVRRIRSDQRGTARHYRLTGRYGIGDADVRRIMEVQRELCPICCDARGEHRAISKSPVWGDRRLLSGSVAAT